MKNSTPIKLYKPEASNGNTFADRKFLNYDAGHSGMSDTLGFAFAVLLNFASILAILAILGGRP